MFVGRGALGQKLCPHLMDIFSFVLLQRCGYGCVCEKPKKKKKKKKEKKGGGGKTVTVNSEEKVIYAPPVQTIYNHWSG